jgi:hypothetical protein
MKKTLLMAGALLALTVGVASAQSGINLSWNDCGVSGGLQRNFACTSNSGANTMVASVITGVDMNQLNGQAGVLDMQTNQPALSPWWQIGTCRLTSTMSADFNFLASSNCFDAWVGGAAGGVNYTPGFNGPNRARIRTVCAIAGSTAITGADEWYMFKVTFTNARTVGTGSCAGCQDGACIVFNSILVTQPAGVGDYTISAPITRNYVQWQGGGNIGGDCPGATPTKSATWGSVKSLYR